jgi:DNA-binding response OmpR family regulator
MLKILLVDDEATNSKILGFHIKTFLVENGINEFVIDEAENGYEAFGMHYFNSYDILMLDVRMPKYDGIKLLNNIRKIKEIKQPDICMVTSFGEAKYKSLFKIKGANSYIIKPFDKEIIYTVLANLLSDKIAHAEEIVVQDDFFDFDDTNDAGDFFDFDDANDFDDNQEKLAVVNLTHGNISAKEFLEDYPNISYILEDIEEIDELIFEIIDSLDHSNLETFRDRIILSLDKYVSFLNSLISFNELSSSLVFLKTNINKINLEEFNERESFYLVNFLVAIFEDLNSWKDHVFITQDANDVFYANASLLSNCMQLEDIIKGKI